MLLGARRVVIEYHIKSGTLQIVELASFQREPEHRTDQEHEYDAQRYEQVEDFHTRDQPTLHHALRARRP